MAVDSALDSGQRRNGATGLVMPVLSREEFELFRKIIYDATGINLSDRKFPMLSNRLRRRLRALGLNSFSEYYRVLKREGPGSEEFYHFLEAVTTNETYFFRNRALWTAVEQRVLPALAKRRPERGTLIFWSAACSSGDKLR